MIRKLSTFVFVCLCVGRYYNDIFNCVYPDLSEACDEETAELYTTVLYITLKPQIDSINCSITISERLLNNRCTLASPAMGHWGSCPPGALACRKIWQTPMMGSGGQIVDLPQYRFSHRITVIWLALTLDCMSHVRDIVLQIDAERVTDRLKKRLALKWPYHFMSNQVCKFVIFLWCMPAFVNMFVVPPGWKSWWRHCRCNRLSDKSIIYVSCLGGLGYFESAWWYVLFELNWGKTWRRSD